MVSLCSLPRFKPKKTLSSIFRDLSTPAPPPPKEEEADITNRVDAENDVKAAEVEDDILNKLDFSDGSIFGSILAGESIQIEEVKVDTTSSTPGTLSTTTKSTTTTASTTTATTTTTTTPRSTTPGVCGGEYCRIAGTLPIISGL